MAFQAEGIRHIEINKKINYDDDKFESDEDEIADENLYSSYSEDSGKSESDNESTSSFYDDDDDDNDEKDNTQKDHFQDFPSQDKTIQNDEKGEHKDSQVDKPTTKKSVNFDSLLKAVIEINDKIDDKERQLKALGDTTTKHYKKGSKHSSLSTKKSRPKTAVLQYRDESEYSSFDENESDSESHISMQSRSSSTIKKKRPQSSPSSHHGLASSSRMNMSFSNEKVRSIDMENQRLLKQLLQTKMSTKKPGVVRKKVPTQSRVQSASSINRNRRQQEIERENLRLLGRLQNVKPSSGVSRNKLLSDHSKHEQFSGRIGKAARPVSAVSHTSNTRRPFSGRSSSSRYFDDSASMMSTSSTRSRKSFQDKITRENLERQRNWSDRW